MILQVGPFEIFRYDKSEVLTEASSPFEDTVDHHGEQMLSHEVQSSDPKEKVHENVIMSHGGPMLN